VIWTKVHQLAGVAVPPCQLAEGCIEICEGIFTINTSKQHAQTDGLILLKDMTFMVSQKSQAVQLMTPWNALWQAGIDTVSMKMYYKSMSQKYPE
jgi:hypothetical protein